MEPWLSLLVILVLVAIVTAFLVAVDAISALLTKLVMAVVGSARRRTAQR